MASRSTRSLDGFMKSRMAQFAAILGAFFLGGCLLLYLYYPALPQGLVGWIALFLIGLPTWAVLEWFGGLVLGAKFFSRLPRAGRIIVGVPVVAVLIAVMFVLVRFGQVVVTGQ